MADVSSDIKDWSVTASSNLPADATTVGAGLADNLQQIQATTRAAFAHKGSDIASAATTDLGAVTGYYHDITGTTTITGFGTVSAGVRKVLQFDGVLTLTYNATSLILPGNANITTAAGDQCEVMSLGSGNWVVLWYTRDAGLVLDEDDMASNSAIVPPSQQSVKAYVDNGATAGGYIRGLILSNNGTDATNDIDISAGACSDGTYSESIVSAAITKQIDAPWAVGTAGGMDTGSVTDSTWYYVWIIKRSDTGVVDALFSLSPTSPTMPTNYDFKRLIGAVYRNSASAIDEFSAYETSGGGVRFRWKTLTTDLSSSLSTTARTDNLRNPDGMVTEVTWLIRVVGASTWAAYFSSPDDTDQAPSASTSTPVGQMFAATGAANHKEISVMTDSSGLVRARGSGSLSTYYVNCVSFEMARR